MGIEFLNSWFMIAKWAQTTPISLAVSEKWGEPRRAKKHSFWGEMVMNYQEAKTDPGKADSTIVGEIVV
jgi:hypothetical protein